MQSSLKLNNLIRLALLLPLVASMTGCFPMLARTVRPIDGVVTQGSMPVQGARIRIDGMEEYTRILETDAAGKFSFVGHRELVLMVLASDPRTHWTLHIEYKGQKYLGQIKTGGFGWESGRILHLRCDLDRQVTVNEHGFQKGICLSQDEQVESSR